VKEGHVKVLAIWLSRMRRRYHVALNRKMHVTPAPQRFIDELKRAVMRRRRRSTALARSP
jgi:hypothetical protein